MSQKTDEFVKKYTEGGGYIAIHLLPELIALVEKETKEDILTEVKRVLPLTCLKSVIIRAIENYSAIDKENE